MWPLEDVEEDPQLKTLRELPNYITLTTIVKEKQLQIIPGVDLVKLQDELESKHQMEGHLVYRWVAVEELEYTIQIQKKTPMYDDEPRWHDECVPGG